jgi:hypothetical protein
VRARFIETRFTELMTDEAPEEAQREWLDDASRRAKIRVLLPEDASVPPPFGPR